MNVAFRQNYIGITRLRNCCLRMTSTFVTRMTLQCISKTHHAPHLHLTGVVGMRYHLNKVKFLFLSLFFRANALLFLLLSEENLMDVKRHITTDKFMGCPPVKANMISMLLCSSGRIYLKAGWRKACCKTAPRAAALEPGIGMVHSTMLEVNHLWRSQTIALNT